MLATGPASHCGHSAALLEQASTMHAMQRRMQPHSGQRRTKPLACLATLALFISLESSHSFLGTPPSTPFVHTRAALSVVRLWHASRALCQPTC